MKILIADSFPESHQVTLTEQGHQVTYQPELSEDTLAAAIDSHEALVVRSTRVNAHALGADNTLRLVIRAGAGTNTIDKASATECGIRVCNVPGANSIAVAELTLGLIISIDRSIPANVQDLRDGIWNKKKYSAARGLYGQRLGILGTGAIGIAVAERALAFGIEVFTVAKPGRSDIAEKRMRDTGIQQVPNMQALLSECDIISLHLPANQATVNMVNAEFLGAMKPGAMLINTSRGELVDEQALINAMDNKGIRAGLDVYANEPGAADQQFDSALARHRNVYGTHHIGASTAQAQDAVANGVLDIISDYQQGGFRNCVNPVQ